MDIKYRIISIDEKDHSFVVRFYTDILTEDSLCAWFNDDNSIRRGDDGKPVRCRSDYNLTMFNVNSSHEDIEKQIQLSAPAEWFAMLEHVRQNDTTVSLTNIKEKINQEVVYTHVPPATLDTTKPTISEHEIADFIARLTNA